jgi:hypothetical protein
MKQAQKFKKPQTITIASTMCWVWGLLLLLIGLAIGFPAIAMKGNISILLFFAIWGGAYCVAGFALPRRKWSVRWWLSILSFLSAAILLLMQVTVSLFGVLLNIAVVGLVMMSWKWLGENR